MAEIIVSDCGCSVTQSKGHTLSMVMNYCPKHQAALELYTALEILTKRVEAHEMRARFNHPCERLMDNIDIILSEARGES